MTCRQFADFIAEYLSGELSPETIAQFESHLAECPNCVAYLSNYRETVRLERAAFTDDERDLPEDVPADLVKAILASRRG